MLFSLEPYVNNEFIYTVTVYINRWDVQRIRELRHNERLREREERKKRVDQDPKETVRSFWPKPDQVADADSDDRLTLCNTERIPVSVFGLTVPRFPVR